MFSLRKLDVWTAQTGSAVPILAIIVVSAVSVVAFIKVAFAGAGRLDRTALRILAFGAALAGACGGLTPLLAGRPHLSSTFVAVPIAAFAVQIAANRQLRGRAAAARPTRGVPRGSAWCRTWRSPRRTRCC